MTSDEINILYQKDLDEQLKELPLRTRRGNPSVFELDIMQAKKSYRLN